MKLQQAFSVTQQIYLRKSASTNEYASVWTSNNNPKTNICVYTYNQTDGRGQIGRFWYSGVDKNLAMTLLLTDLHIDIKEQFLLNKTISLAVYEAISAHIENAQVCIKWPNDIYIDNKKAAGILVQNQIRKGKIHQTIIGIGLNVNENAFPEDIPNPISIFESTGKKQSLFKIKNELLNKVLQHLNQMPFAKVEIEKRYDKQLFRKGIKSQFEIEGINTEGTILGVSNQGKLIINIEESEKHFAFRELNFII